MDQHLKIGKSKGKLVTVRTSDIEEDVILKESVLMTDMLIFSIYAS